MESSREKLDQSRRQANNHKGSLTHPVITSVVATCLPLSQLGGDVRRLNRPNSFQADDASGWSSARIAFNAETLAHCEDHLQSTLRRKISLSAAIFVVL